MVVLGKGRIVNYNQLSPDIQRKVNEAYGMTNPKTGKRYTTEEFAEERPQEFSEKIADFEKKIQKSKEPEIQQPMAFGEEFNEKSYFDYAQEEREYWAEKRRNEPFNTQAKQMHRFWKNEVETIKKGYYIEDGERKYITEGQRRHLALKNDFNYPTIAEREQDVKEKATSFFGTPAANLFGNVENLTPKFIKKIKEKETGYQKWYGKKIIEESSFKDYAQKQASILSLKTTAETLATRKKTELEGQADIIRTDLIKQVETGKKTQAEAETEWEQQTNELQSQYSTYIEKDLGKFTSSIEKKSKRPLNIDIPIGTTWWGYASQPITKYTEPKWKKFETELYESTGRIIPEQIAYKFETSKAKGKFDISFPEFNKTNLAKGKISLPEPPKKDVFGIGAAKGGYYVLRYEPMKPVAYFGLSFGVGSALGFSGATAKIGTSAGMKILGIAGTSIYGASKGAEIYMGYKTRAGIPEWVEKKEIVPYIIGKSVTSELAPSILGGITGFKAGYWARSRMLRPKLIGVAKGKGEIKWERYSIKDAKKIIKEGGLGKEKYHLLYKSGKQYIEAEITGAKGKGVSSVLKKSGKNVIENAGYNIKYKYYEMPKGESSLSALRYKSGSTISDFRRAFLLTKEVREGAYREGIFTAIAKGRKSGDIISVGGRYKTTIQVIDEKKFNALTEIQAGKYMLTSGKKSVIIDIPKKVTSPNLIVATKGTVKKALFESGSIPTKGLTFTTKEGINVQLLEGNIDFNRLLLQTETKSLISTPFKYYTTTTAQKGKDLLLIPSKKAQVSLVPSVGGGGIIKNTQIVPSGLSLSKRLVFSNLYPSGKIVGGTTELTQSIVQSSLTPAMASPFFVPALGELGSSLFPKKITTNKLNLKPELDILPSLNLKPLGKYEPIQESESGLTIVTKTITIPKVTTITKTITETEIVPAIPPILPPMPLPVLPVIPPFFTGGEKRKKRSITQGLFPRGYKYKPSLWGVAKGLKAKKGKVPKILTGFSIRPMINGGKI